MIRKLVPVQIGKESLIKAGKGLLELINLFLWDTLREVDVHLDQRKAQVPLEQRCRTCQQVEMEIPVKDDAETVRSM